MQIHNGILNKRHIINHSWLHPGTERPVFVGAVTVLIHSRLDGFMRAKQIKGKLTEN